MQCYVVTSGDDLDRIARRHGLRSWRDIYYHPRNAALRARRPDPTQVVPGDQLMLPGPGEVVRWRKRTRRPRPTKINRAGVHSEPAHAAPSRRRSAA